MSYHHLPELLKRQLSLCPAPRFHGRAPRGAGTGWICPDAQATPSFCQCFPSPKVERATVPPGCCENTQRGVRMVGQQLAGTTVVSDGRGLSVLRQKPDLFLPRKCPLLLGHLLPELARQESHCLSAAFSIWRGHLTHLLAPRQTAVSADTRLQSTEAGSQSSPMA